MNAHAVALDEPAAVQIDGDWLIARPDGAREVDLRAEPRDGRLHASDDLINCDERREPAQRAVVRG